jgi:hypothetical protein
MMESPVTAEERLYWSPRSIPGRALKVSGIPISGMSGYRTSKVDNVELSVANPVR